MNKNFRAMKVLPVVVVLAASMFAILRYSPSVARSSLIFADGFETNSFGGWDRSLAGPSGAVVNTSSVNPYEGRYSAYASVDGSVNGQAAYVEKVFPDQSELYIRSYVYFTSFSLPSSRDIIYFCRVKSSVTGTIAYAGLRNDNGAVKFFVYDAIAWVPAYGSVVFAGQYYCLELHVKLGKGSSDGEIQLYVDGNSNIDMTGRNLTSLGSISTVRMGIPTTTGAGPAIFPSCSLYMDSCIVGTQYIGKSAPSSSWNVTTLPIRIRASTVLQNGTLLAASTNQSTNQVYESIDNGLSWQLHSTLPRNADDQKAMYTTSMDTVLLADVLTNENGQVYRFENGGWVVVLKLGINETIWNFQEAKGIVYAGTYSEYTESLGHAKLWASRDDGVTWSLLSNFSGYRHIHEVFVNTNGYIYAALGDVPCALMRSTDNGSTWTNLNSTYLFTAITAVPNSNVIYLGGDSGPQIFSFYDNGGSTVSFGKIYDGAYDSEGAILWIARVNNVIVFGEYSTKAGQNVTLSISDASWTTFTSLTKQVASTVYYGFYYCARSFWKLQNLVTVSPNLLVSIQQQTQVINITIQPSGLTLGYSVPSLVYTAPDFIMMNGRTMHFSSWSDGFAGKVRTLYSGYNYTIAYT
jgi:hypothetical protein